MFVHCRRFEPNKGSRIEVEGGFGAMLRCRLRLPDALDFGVETRLQTIEERPVGGNLLLPEPVVIDVCVNRPPPIHSCLVIGHDLLVCGTIGG